MPLEVVCPTCKRSQCVADEVAGRPTQCFQCGGELIPATVGGDASETSTALAASLQLTADVMKPASMLGGPLEQDEQALARGCPQQGLGPDDVDPGSRTPLSMLAETAGRKYNIGKVVAKGGMGAILEAKDLTIRRRVAMKVMLNPTRADRAKLLRFVEEAQITGQLEHPSIVPVHDLGVDARGNVFYTMKFVKGMTLKQIIAGIASGKPEIISKYTLSHLLTIFLKACDALAFAHRKGVIHRDLKPDNVMVGEFGEVLVMDWGLAKVLAGGAGEAEGAQSTSATDCTSAAPRVDAQARSARIESTRHEASASNDTDELHTLDGQVMGTPYFMAPEQAQGNIGQLDARTDIYALGAILYTILTLHPPVGGRNIGELLANVARGKIDPPTRSNPAGTRVRLPRPISGLLFTTADQPPATDGGAARPLALAHIPGGVIPQALSSIAMKALALAPTDRYQSVDGLQADIERFQGGFATLAERATLGRQLALLVKRHRGFVAAAALVSAAVIVGFVVALMQRHQAVVARHAAEESERRAVAARAATEAALRAAEIENYCTTIAAADARIREGTISAAESALWNAPPTLRHWEWGHLLLRCQPLNPVVSGAVRPEVAMSPAGTHVVHTTGGWNLAVRDLRTGTATVTLVGHPTEVKCLAWSPDGRLIASGGGDRTLRLWDAVTGKELNRIAVEAEFVSCVAFSPDSRRIACGDQGGIVRVCDAQTGEEAVRLKAPFEDHRAACVSVCFSPDGRWLLTGHQVIGAVLWDAATGREIRQYRLNRAGNRAVFSPDGRSIAIGYQEIQILDPEDGRDLGLLHGHESVVYGLAFTADGQSRVSASMDRTVRVWDMKTRRERLRLVGHQGAVRSLALAGAIGLAVSGGSEGMLNFWDVSRPVEPVPLNEVGSSGPSAFSPDGRRIASTGYAGRVTIHEAATAQCLFSATGHTQSGLAVAFAPDGHWFVTSSADGSVKVWDAADGRERLALQGHEGAVPSVAVSPDGRTILTCGIEDDAVRLWDAASGVQTLVLADQGGCKSCGFSPDGALLAVASISRPASIWNTRDGSQRRQMAGPKDGQAVCFSPDGRRLAVGYTDFTARVFESETGTELLCLRSHGEWVTAVRFSSDGKRLTTVARDRSLKIWDAETGRELLSVPCRDTAYSLDIARDGLALVTAGQVFHAFDWRTATHDTVAAWRQQRWQRWLTDNLGN